MRGRLHLVGQGMYLRASRKLHQGLRGDLSLRAKGHFKGGPKTLDETMMGYGILVRRVSLFHP